MRGKEFTGKGGPRELCANYDRKDVGVLLLPARSTLPGSRMKNVESNVPSPSGDKSGRIAPPLQRSDS